MNPIPDVAAAVAAVRKIDERKPEVGLILGSGLGSLADAAMNCVEIPTSSIPDYPHSTVAGHTGSLVIGEMAGKTVAFIRGRVHCYEGHSVRSVSFPVRLLRALGADKLIVTNAAGGANPSFKPGTIMFIHDHINFAFRNPLVGSNVDGGPRFPDMSEPYDLAWIKAAERYAAKESIATTRGVYLWTLGPSYESKAEVRAFTHLGADAIGMSTVPEVIQAIYFGMRVIGISTITNRAAGLEGARLDHEEVLRVGQRVSANLKRLLVGILESA